MVKARSHRCLLIAGVSASALLGAVLTAPGAVAETRAEAQAGTAAAAPALQLPFPCNQKWRLDTWAHSPALDMVKDPSQHGTDGATLLAAAAGTVNQSYYHNQAGNVIQIKHGGGYYTTYLHLKSRSVSKGASVRQGTVIGKVGKTGRPRTVTPTCTSSSGTTPTRTGAPPGASRGPSGSSRSSTGSPSHREQQDGTECRQPQHLREQSAAGSAGPAVRRWQVHGGHPLRGAGLLVAGQDARTGKLNKGTATSSAGCGGRRSRSAMPTTTGG